MNHRAAALRNEEPSPVPRVGSRSTGARLAARVDVSPLDEKRTFAEPATDFHFEFATPERECGGGGGGGVFFSLPRAAIRIAVRAKITRSREKEICTVKRWIREEARLPPGSRRSKINGRGRGCGGAGARARERVTQSARRGTVFPREPIQCVRVIA